MSDAPNQTMSPTIIDGRAMAAAGRAVLKSEVAGLRERGATPHLAVVVLGDDLSARAYIRGIERTAAAVDVRCTVHRLESSTTIVELTAVLDMLGAAEDVHGIIVQAPLPAGLDLATAGMHVAVAKDVDGVNPTSAGRLLLGLPSYPPATATAVMEAVRAAGVNLRGARTVVIGRSAIVGKPVALLLLREDATVTLCHSRTADLPGRAREADLLVVAVGRARLVGADYVKPGAVVIDVGINDLDGQMVGDVDFDAVAPLAAAITPVPGGIGPLTNVMLLRNTVAACRALTGLE